MMFKDREQAADLLAASLSEFKGRTTLILAIPRGGVVLGRRIAQLLECELDIVTPRKLRHQEQAELALGAALFDGSKYINPQVHPDDIDKDYFEQECRQAIKESDRRMKSYRGQKKLPVIKNRTVVIVDDGAATGSTMIVAARYVRNQKAKKVVIAIPLAAQQTLDLLKPEADQVVCLEVPHLFFALGQFYQHFDQVGDSEVKKLLDDYWGTSSK